MKILLESFRQLSLIARILITICVSISCFAQTATVGLSDGDEFVGPFASWTNIKTTYGAVGDGVTDDTIALQTALGNVGVGSNSPVLYLPAGTYRISSTLGIGSARQGISIIGQDPSSTQILWAGPSGQEMLYLNGVGYSKISRITWNGSGTALAAIDYGWNGTGPYGGSTYVEDSDEIFENLSYGIRGGTGGYEDSEHAILRCKFLYMKSAGLSTENYNALDWYVWDCSFIGNYVGVTNQHGGGNFHVFGSYFQSSSFADIWIGPTSFFSMRQNFSQNSNAFLIVNASGSASAAITLQGNTILDSVSSPLQINNPGTVLFFDNIVRGNSSQTAPLITVKDAFDVPTVPGGLVAIGNTLSQSNWYSVPNGGETISINNNVVSRSSINPQAPTMPGALPNYNRHVVEVPSGSNQITIQQAIDASLVYSGQRPVVHLPAGDYPITYNIVIPVGSDVQLVGDGGGATGPTKLHWLSSALGPVVRLPGPSRATLRDFNVFGGSQGTGILIQNADQASGRVFMEQLDAQELTQFGVTVNGLDNTSVLLHDGYIVSDNLGIQVTGGPIGATGQTVPARTDMFASLTASNNLTYNVTNHGKLMSQDAWYEGAGAQLVNLNDAGTFTLHGAHIGAQDAGHGGVQQNVPTFGLSNFNGSVSLLGAELVTRNSVGVYGTATNTNMLALGILGPSDNSNFFVDGAPQLAQVAMVDSRQSTPNGGSNLLTDVVTGVSSVPTFVSTMVAQTRAEVAAPLAVLPSNTTDARLYRVSVYGGNIGVEIDASGTGSLSAPNVSGVNVATNSTTATITWTTDQVSDTQVFYGPTNNYGSSSSLDVSNVTSHSVVIQGLFLGTIYHFVVKSRSLSGYVGTSPDQTFTTPSISTPASFGTSLSPGLPENNFTGWLGMKINVGSASPLITALGRMMLNGNYGTHTVKLVRASDGSDVAGGSVTISMAGGTPGSFVYGFLPSSIYLSANTSYYLVSSEVSGGDQWFNVGAISGTSVATIGGAVYTDSAGNYQLGNTSSVGYGPLNFQFQVLAKDTTPPVGAALLTGFAPGNLRNNYSGFVGMDLVVNSTPIAVNALGRLFVSGNSGYHLLKLVNAATGADVPGGSATINMPNGSAGQFAYVSLPSPVVLPAFTSYYLVSQETAGGDYWYDVTSVTPGALASISGPVYNNGNQFMLVKSMPGQSYVPVNLLYTTLSSPPPTGTITSPAVGTNYSSSSTVNITASASAAAGLSVASVQFQVDETNIGGPQTSAPYSAVLSTKILAPGTHWLAVNVTDSAGNMSTSPAVTIFVIGASNSTGSGIPLIGAFTTSNLRNDFTGFVGTKIIVGQSPINIYALGRIYVPGNSGQHIVKLVDVNSGTDIAGGSVVIPVAVGTPGQVTYTALSSPITLAAYGAYYVVSQETTGGDLWYDYLSVSGVTGSTIMAPAYANGNTSAYKTLDGLFNSTYGPVNFLYSQ